MSVHGTAIDHTGRYVLRRDWDNYQPHEDLVPPGLTIRAMLKLEDQMKQAAKPDDQPRYTPTSDEIARVTAGVRATTAPAHGRLFGASMTILDHTGRYVFERDVPHYTPTPAEIASVTESIRAGWSDAELAKRLGANANPPAEVRQVRYIGPERDC